MKPAAVVTSGLVAATALAGASLKVTLRAPTHTPRINVRWPYTVRAAESGRPAVARITVQIVDPLGGVHPVKFGTSTRNITRRRFTGAFRDFVIWPPESRGVTLKFRVVVATARARKVVSYRVTPHA